MNDRRAVKHRTAYLTAVAENLNNYFITTANMLIIMLFVVENRFRQALSKLFARLTVQMVGKQI